jgi:hypothetical protein
MRPVTLLFLALSLLPWPEGTTKWMRWNAVISASRTP